MPCDQLSTAPSCGLSIIVPAYNEANRLPATLERLDQYLAGQPLTFELLVVDDGSTDATRQVVLDFAGTRPWARLVCYDSIDRQPLNRGKGFAVRQGVAHSRGELVLFSDADLSTPIEEMEKLLPPLQSGEFEVTIASRAKPESNLAVHQPWYREAMGRAFNKAVQLVAVPGITDTQCGFKAFTATAAQRLFGVAQIDGFGFDTEILFLARKFDYRVSEIAVTWRHREESRVNPLSAPIRMMLELFQVRINDRRGRYGK